MAYMKTSPRPVVTGPIWGWTPAGRLSWAWTSRSLTCWRAKYRSTFSSKITVTWEKPLRDRDRVDCRPGMPAMAVSTGKVTRFSISTGESEASEVLIWTWLLVMSGTASIGSWVNCQAP